MEIVLKKVREDCVPIPTDETLKDQNMRVLGMLHLRVGWKDKIMNIFAKERKERSYMMAVFDSRNTGCAIGKGR